MDQQIAQEDGGIDRSLSKCLDVHDREVPLQRDTE